MDHGLRIETNVRLSRVHPSYWIVTAEWYGGRVTVFESDSSHPDFVQLSDCFDYVRELDSRV